ncbi:MAG: hypothetical protein AB4057_19750 [Crocosphaera sp.]
MDFKQRVNELHSNDHIEEAEHNTALAWWTSLCVNNNNGCHWGTSEFCTLAFLRGAKSLELLLPWIMVLQKWTAPYHLRQNIEYDTLFEIADDSHERLSNFVRKLNSISEIDPITKVRKAINNNCNNTPCVVCAGPSASPGTLTLVRLIHAQTAYKYLGNKETISSYPINPQTKTLDLKKLRDWTKFICDPDIYHEQLQDDNLVRGQLPNSFWTTQEDIDTFFQQNPNADVKRITAFLGIYSVGDNEPWLLISTSVDELENQNISRSVPTGWDGFDNPYFLPFSIKSEEGVSLKTPEMGKTLDIENNQEGASELVTPPVPVSLTNPVKCL